MLKQILKIIWKQRRSNVYLLIELVLVCIFTCYIIDYMVVQTFNRMTPDGFDTEHVYQVDYTEIEPGTPEYNDLEGDSLHTVANLRRFIDRIRKFPGVEGVAVGDRSAPHQFYSVSNRFAIGEDSVPVMVRRFYPESDYFKVFRYQPVSGKAAESLDHRFWKKEDVLVALRKYRSPFPDRIAGLDSKNTITSLHVADVLQSVKEYSYEQPEEMVFKPMALTNDLSDIILSIRITERISGEHFVEKFTDRMYGEPSIGNIRYMGLTSYDFLRDTMEYEKNNMTRLLFALLAFFWLNMALCIYGAFCLKNEARLCESGIRMAAGCSRTRLFKSFLLESWILVTAASVIGFAVVANLFSAEVLITVDSGPSANWINKPEYRFAVSAAITWVLLIGLVSVSAWIPAYRAMRLQPSEILHEE